MDVEGAAVRRFGSRTWNPKRCLAPHSIAARRFKGSTRAVRRDADPGLAVSDGACGLGSTGRSARHRSNPRPYRVRIGAARASRSARSSASSVIAFLAIAGAPIRRVQAVSAWYASAASLRRQAVATRSNMPIRTPRACAGAPHATRGSVVRNGGPTRARQRRSPARPVPRSARAAMPGAGARSTMIPARRARSHA